MKIDILESTDHRTLLKLTFLLIAKLYNETYRRINIGLIPSTIIAFSNACSQVKQTLDKTMNFKNEIPRWITFLLLFRSIRFDCDLTPFFE